MDAPPPHDQDKPPTKGVFRGRPSQRKSLSRNPKKGSTNQKGAIGLKDSQRNMALIPTLLKFPLKPDLLLLLLQQQHILRLRPPRLNMLQCITVVKLNLMLC
jgi:hypothetical protein